jgi:hypothetical protein
VIKSYFSHYRATLPLDPSFHIRDDFPPVQIELTAADILEVIHAADLRYRNMILVKWQSYSDNERLICANLHCGDQLVEHLQADIHPAKLDLPGRKSNENDPEGAFYTCIGSDSVTALREYFDEERGWPDRGEPIWTYPENHKAVTKPAFEATWLRLEQFPFKQIGLPDPEHLSPDQQTEIERIYDNFSRRDFPSLVEQLKASEGPRAELDEALLLLIGLERSEANQVGGTRGPEAASHFSFPSIPRTSSNRSSSSM